MRIYKKIVSPVLYKLDSETWHIRAREALHWAEVVPGGLKLVEQFSYKRKRFSHPKLRINVSGIDFDNPLLGGAGWDKEGRAVRGIWRLGAAGVEVGGVLAYPQYGNPKPRQFVVAPGVIVNRLGFNSGGKDRVFVNLWRYFNSGIPIGINVSENREVVQSEAPEDHARACVLVVRKMYHLSSWFTLGLSSPNTPKMRRLQGKKWLIDIVSACLVVMGEMGGRKPLFIKIAPDLTLEELDEVIEVALEYGVGIVASNTTINLDIKAKYGFADQPGGLSGDDEDFRAMSTRQIAYIYVRTAGGVPIMGAGGVKDTRTALEKIKAGASLLAIVSAIRGEGPTVFGRITRGLAEYMGREGIGSILELVGVDAANYAI
jgi:dihydroorotate dehydrogenase